jgi:hypothetical protein
MADSDDATIEAKVTQYDIARLRLGQLLVPLAVIATVMARRMPTMLPVSVAFALQALGLAVFLSAAKRFGSQPLRFEGGAVAVGATGVRIERIKVHRWTLVNRVARLYGVKVSYKLSVESGTEHALSALLRSQFGSPVQLDRRGSKQARVLALGVGLAGLVFTVLAIVNDSRVLAFVGAPAFLLGIATFGALSQRSAAR